MGNTWKRQKTPEALLNESKPTAEVQALYDKYWAEVQIRQRSSSENFDKSILTYSSSGLAISLTFLKDFVPAPVAKVWPSLLYGSWALFLLATSLTIISFLVSYRAQELSLKYAEAYLIHGDVNSQNRKSPLDVFIKWSNILSGGAFIVALILTSLFVGLNLEKRNEMNLKKGIAQDGMPTAIMPTVGSGFQKGMPTASMPLAPASQKPASQPTGQGQGGSATKTK
jgi:putative Mn2+ efflux pump MntP